MQFRLHINETPDGSKVADELRRLADILDGAELTPGMMRSVHNGYAVVDGETKVDLLALLKELREACETAEPYIAGAYECAFPNRAEVDSDLEFIQSVIAKSAEPVAAN